MRSWVLVCQGRVVLDDGMASCSLHHFLRGTCPTRPRVVWAFKSGTEAAGVEVVLRDEHCEGTDTRQYAKNDKLSEVCPRPVIVCESRTAADSNRHSRPSSGAVTNFSGGDGMQSLSGWPAFLD